MPSNKDYIPDSDAEAVIWMRNYGNFVIIKGTANGLTGTEASDVNQAWLQFESSIRDVAAAEAALAAAIQTKRAKRAAAEQLIRRTRAIMAPNLVAPDRAEAGLTVLDATPTPKAPPTSRPIARIDGSKPLAHSLRFTDADSPTRRAKPVGVRHVEVWLKLGDPKPSGPAEMRFVGIASRPPFRIEFEGPDAGKPAHYLLRWVSSRNQPGPWSELHSATVAGI